MQADRWKTIEEMFHAALERPPEQRAAYLDSVCGADSELRREVECLLDETTKTESFLERPAGSVSLEEPSLEGRVLNHYEIGPMVGRGGMAEVYRARDRRLERDVAIKILHQAQLLDGERLEPLYREARVLASLNHPNIASIHGIEEAGGLCGIVLELVEGETLSERIRRSRLTVRETIGIAKQIAAGLQAAHAKGIIHRDVKPSNVKITHDGTVKIVDFGIAKLLRSLDPPEASPDTYHHGVAVGTLAYMSPEQARGKPIDARTDIWAFGCVLYEMLVGDAAFRGDTPSDLIVRIAAEEPDWNVMRQLAEVESHGLQRVIRKCMQKNPDDRYQSVREIAAELDRTPSQTPESDADFVLPGRWAVQLFQLAQVGYLALYTAAMYHVEAIARILAVDFQVAELAGLMGTMILAMCGFAVRIYLISAVGWRHPAAGRKFTLLFPSLLALDSIWAASPLLLWRHIGFGLALVCVVMLAYVPFAERTLMRTIYPKHQPRT